MRKVAASLVCFAFANSAALGGIVTFSPEKDSVLPGQAAVYDIIVSSSDLGEFDTVNLLLGTDDPLDLVVTYDADWLASTSLPPADPLPFFVYPVDLNFGGSNFGLWTAPLLVATLSIDTTGLAEGQYSFLVSAAEETIRAGVGLSSLQIGFSSEPLEGVGLLNVVPEPATLALLGIGAVTLLRRRRIA